MDDPKWNGLRARIRDILLSDACQKIKFTCEGLTIDGSGYTYVALSLIAKPSKTGGFRFSSYVAKDAEAMCDSDNRIFYFKTPDYAQDPDSEEALTVVHECTHALIGALKGTKILRSSNEACAFIAEQVYNVHRGSPAPQPLESEAFKLAQRMVRVAKQWNYTGPYALDKSDLAPVKNWMLQFKAYHWLKGQPNYTDKNPGLGLS